MWRPSSLQTRGSAAAQAGSTDPAAAVHAGAAIDLLVPAGLVWDVLTDVGAWPSFLPGVSRTRLVPPPVTSGRRLDESSSFEWVNGGITLRSRVEVVAPGRELTWTGVALWLVAVHRNTIEPAGDHACRLTSTESMAGVGAAWAMPATTLERRLDAFVHAIGNEARRRHTGTVA